MASIGLDLDQATALRPQRSSGRAAVLLSANGLGLRLGHPGAAASDGYPTALDATVLTKP